jgi:hypothetical protein
LDYESDSAAAQNMEAQIKWQRLVFKYRRQLLLSILIFAGGEIFGIFEQGLPACQYGIFKEAGRFF